VSAAAGNGTALVSVATSQIGQTDLRHRTLARAHHADRHRRALRPGRTAPIAIADPGPSAVAHTSTTLLALEFAVALVLAAVAFAAWRGREVR
jgi:hypothetical protein